MNLVLDVVVIISYLDCGYIKYIKSKSLWAHDIMFTEFFIGNQRAYIFFFILFSQYSAVFLSFSTLTLHHQCKYLNQPSLI